MFGPESAVVRQMKTVITEQYDNRAVRQSKPVEFLNDLSDLFIHIRHARHVGVGQSSCLGCGGRVINVTVATLFAPVGSGKQVDARGHAFGAIIAVKINVGDRVVQIPVWFGGGKRKVGFVKPDSKEEWLRIVFVIRFELSELGIGQFGNDSCRIVRVSNRCDAVPEKFSLIGGGERGALVVFHCRMDGLMVFVCGISSFP